MKRHLCGICLALAFLTIPVIAVTMQYGQHIEGEVADPYASAPASVAVWLWDDSGTDTWVMTDDTGEYIISDFATTDDHGNLAGLTDDADHTWALNGTRHSITHDSAFNNGQSVSGFIASDATLGAHGANGLLHYFRPARSLIVAQNATGQYATISTAVTAANAVASSSSPQEVLVFAGSYSENNMTLNDHVSVRAETPNTVTISTNSANPVFRLDGNNRLTSLRIVNIGAGGCLLATGGISALIDIDNCFLSAGGSSGSVLDFNGDNSTITVFGQSTLQSFLTPIITGKTSSGSTLNVHNSTLLYAGALAPNPSVINIDGSNAITPDLFSDCTFSMVALAGGTSPSAFIDWDANALQIRNCLFRLRVPSAKEIRGLWVQSGSVKSHGNFFEWAGIFGTPYDYYTEAGATVETIATAYDVDQVGGAGTIVALSQGDMAGNDLYLTGQLNMDGDDTPLLFLRPSGTASQTVVSIVPQNAIGASAGWFARLVSGGNLDPTGASASVRGDFIDFLGVSQVNNPLIIGWQLDMPVNYTSSSEVAAAKYSGDGRVLVLCNDDHAIEATAATSAAGLFTYSGALTNVVRDPLHIAQFTTGNMGDGFGASAEFIIKDVAGVENDIAGIAAVRDGADTTGKLSFFCGANGAAENLIIFGDNQISIPNAVSVATGFLVDGQGSGGVIYDDGFGLTIDGSNGGPLIEGQDIFMKLGDAAGANDLFVLDSGDVTQWSVNSDGDMLVNGEITYGQTYEITLPVPLTSAGLGPSNNPDFVQFLDDGGASTGIFQWAFSPNIEEELNFSITINQGYVAGTNILPVVHWSPNGTGGLNEFAQWGLEYAWENIDAVWDFSTIATTDASAAGTATTSGDATMLAFKNYASEFPAIDGTGMERHSILVGRIFRDATDGDDDYANDAFGLLLDIHITIDQPGDPN